jgi:hypothetical protein
MPRPSLVLVLEAPAEVIAARKAQLTESELVRQMKEWHDVLPSKQRRLYLDTSAPLPDVLQEAARAISTLAGAPMVSGPVAGSPSTAEETRMAEASHTEGVSPAGGGRGLLWLPLLQRLTVLSPTAVVWKNATSALQGHGDLDLIATPSDWGTIEGEFYRWAKVNGLHPVVVCRHMPGSMFLLAADPEGSALFELDVKSRGTFRGTTIFRCPDLQPLSEMDARGFRRLRPGAEGLLKFFLNGITEDGALDHARLDRERVVELVQADPAGARQAAQLFGSLRGRVGQLLECYLRGEWSRARMRVLQARLRSRLLLEPVSVSRRLWRRIRHDKGCRGIKSLIKEGRLMPGDSSGLQQLALTHPSSAASA